MKKLLTSLTLCLFMIGLLQAQNPYASLGEEASVLTLSQGKYQEHFPNEAYVVIGGVKLNTETGKVIDLLEPEEEESLETTVSTRFLSVDPIAREYPELTPYQFAANRPIIAIDIDGLEDWIVNVNGDAINLPRALKETGVFNGPWANQAIAQQMANEDPNKIYNRKKPVLQIAGEFIADMTGDKDFIEGMFEAREEGAGWNAVAGHALWKEKIASGGRFHARGIGSRGKGRVPKSKGKIQVRGIVKKGTQKKSDFITEHSYNRHKFDENAISTRSRTRYGKDVDVKSIREQTLNSPDDIVKEGVQKSVSFSFYDNIIIEVLFKSMAKFSDKPPFNFSPFKDFFLPRFRVTDQI